MKTCMKDYYCFEIIVGAYNEVLETTPNQFTYSRRFLDNYALELNFFKEMLICSLNMCF